MRKPQTKSPRSLDEYRSKRKFERTPEPVGRVQLRRRGALRFCVQKHLASHLHYDLRLEHKGVLLSWAVPKGLSLNPREKRLAMMTEDHPLEYGDFEGVIPEGYGAGIVMVWDTGTWRPIDPKADIDRALEKGKLDFELDGYKLKGSWTLVRTARGAEGSRSNSKSWLLIKHRDHWAGDLDVTEVAPSSVKSDRNLAQILAEQPEVWHSDKPARNGRAGKLLQSVIRTAAEMRAEREPRRPKPSPRKPALAHPAAKHGDTLG